MVEFIEYTFNVDTSQFTEMNNKGDIMVEFIEYTFNVDTQLKSVFIIKK